MSNKLHYSFLNNPIPKTGSSEAFHTEKHAIFHTPLTCEISPNYQQILLGMGCFWGAERLFWQLSGVISTSVGYSGGITQFPTYAQVCQGDTQHAEVVQVVFDPEILSLNQLLKWFWENHDPTQGNRQGNDIGSQYRSIILCTSETQLNTAKQAAIDYENALMQAKHQAPITTEIDMARDYYFAETYHQQYLYKNPDGYCGLSGLSVCFPSSSNHLKKP